MLRLFGLLFLLSLSTYGQTPNEKLEKGYPVLVNYASEDVGGSLQCFAIAQKNNGLILVGNKSGVLEFDGETFRKIETDNKSLCRSLYVSDNDQVFVGSINSFGVLQVDSIGNRYYQSLSKSLPDSVKFGEIWDITSFQNQVVFQAKNHLFFWSETALSRVETKEEIASLMSLEGRLYVFLKSGNLFTIENETKKLNKVRSNVEAKYLSKAIGARTLKSGKILLATSTNLYIVEKLGNDSLGLQELESPINTYIQNQQILDFEELKNQNIAIGTSGGGALILSPEGELVNHLNYRTGLQDLIVNDVFQDANGNLWLALNKGVSVLGINLPVSHFGNKSGIKGTIENLCRHKGSLYCATNDGIYKLITKSIGEEGIDFQKISNLQCWDLISFKTKTDTLLIGAMNDGVYHVKENGNISLIKKNYPWKLHQSSFDSSLLFIGIDPGLTTLRYTKQGWEFGGYHTNETEPIFNFQEIDSTLWCGTFRDGIAYRFGYKKNLKESTIESLDKDLPNGAVYTGAINDGLLLATDSTIFSFRNQELHPFIPFDKSDSLGRYVHRIKSFQNKRLYAVTVRRDERFEIGYFELDQKEWIHAPFSTMNKGIIHAIVPEESGIVWFGGVEGLYRYDANLEFDYEKDFNCEIRKVIVNRDQLIYNGGFSKTKNLQYANLEPEQNNLKFEFAAISIFPGQKMKYSYRLLGYTEEWSSFNEVNQINYTNLDPGQYSFEVKAKNVYGIESTVASFKFTINPPWYETSWYYFGQFSVIALLVFVTVFLNRKKGDSEFTAVMTFIVLITIFEFVVFLIEPVMEPFFGGVPIFNLLMNIALALSLNPIEYWVRGKLKGLGKKTD